MRRLIRDISSVLIITGLLLVADAVVTVAWQEPLTAVVAMIRRGEIDHRFESLRSSPLSAVDASALRAVAGLQGRVAFLARREAQEVSIGDGIGRITIKRIGLNMDVLQGTDEDTLQKGPGHYPSTAFPGLGRTVAIAGHRTTYLAPFRHVDKLRPGDPIVVTMPYGRFTYLVQYLRVVLPTDLGVVRDVGYERLVLSACHPLYSASHRIIVFARLAEMQPLGAAGRTAT